MSRPSGGAAARGPGFAVCLSAGLLLASCAANGDARSTSATTESVASTTVETTAAPTTAAPTTVPAVATTTPPTTESPTTTTTSTTTSTSSTTPSATLATVPPIAVSTIPVTSPSDTATTPATTTTTPVTTTTTTATTTTTPDPVAVETLLVADSDLPRAWDVSEAESYVGRRDDEIADACPAADALNRIDLQLRWRADSTNGDILVLQQMVGAYPSARAAAADVEEVALIPACDLADFFFGSEIGGGPLDLPGADAASSFVVDSTGGGGAYVEVIVIAVGPVVSLVIATGSSDTDAIDDFATAAAAKIERLTR